MKKIIIAIDGHSSCGKSTMAKQLAQQVGYIYVDSGAMYRAVALFALREQLFLPSGELDIERLRQQMPNIEIRFHRDAQSGLPRTMLNGEDVEDEIRSIEVSQWVSPVATLDFVRAAMTQQQQRMGQARGIVMDGRDIGTAVFPEAELKIFVTASAQVRAQRRFDELIAKGMPAEFDTILKNVEERDYIDSHRAINPLRKADDALTLDNSTLSIAEQNRWLFEQFERATCD